MTKYVVCSAHAPHMLRRTVHTIAAQFRGGAAQNHSAFQAHPNTK
jgi:hypothetical protein